MSAPQPNPTTRGNPSIDWILLQNFATMVDEYRPRALQADEAARIARHQLDVVSRYNDELTGALDIAHRRIEHMDAFLNRFTRFTQRIIAAIADIQQDDDIVQEYNFLVNEYNRHNPIDLTEEEEE